LRAEKRATKEFRESKEYREQIRQFRGHKAQRERPERPGHRVIPDRILRFPARKEFKGRKATKEILEILGQPEQIQP
jgi:hypothetical protein